MALKGTAKNKVQLSLDDDLHEVVEVLSDLKSKWRQLGVQLRVSSPALEEIYHQFKADLDMAMLEMLTKWFKMDTPHTWSAIVNALRRKAVDENVLAQKIEEKYINAEKFLAESTKLMSSAPAKLTYLKELQCDEDEDLEHLEDPDPNNSSTILENLSYTCLNMTGMSAQEKSSLRGKLTNDYRRINKEYSNLNRSIRKSLQDRQIVPRQISDVLMELNTFSLHVHDKKKPLLAEHMSEIENAEDILHVFKILRPYGSFFDCYVIEHIVESELGTDDDRKKLKSYTDKLNAYCKRSIYECPHFATPEQDPKFCTLVMKIDDDVELIYTIKALDAFRDRLATVLDLQGHALHLCSVEKGCLQITFQIPLFVTKAIFPLSQRQRKELKELSILRVDCNGNQFLASINETVLDISSISDSQPTALSVTPSSAGGPARYCYIHVDGIHRHKTFFTFQRDEIEPIDMNKLCQVNVQTHLLERDCNKQLYRTMVDHSHHELQAQRPLHKLLEIQDRAVTRQIYVFLMEEYMSDIRQKLLESLTWLSEQRLTPKLEGRFGLLPWRQNISKCETLSFETEEFVKAAFEDHFLTKVSEDDVRKIKEECTKRDGHVDTLETYDFKLTSKGEKLDIRLKFSDGKPKIIIVKKFEYKFAIFDVLCFNRNYDMRVSLNTFQSASTESDIAKTFAATVSMITPGKISFVPRAQNDEWTVAFIRHKKIDTFYFKQPKYAITVSKVEQIPIEVKDLKPGERIIINDNMDYEHRSEIEFHNLSWEVKFGHQIGLKPEEALVLFIGQESIPQSFYSASVDEDWTPDSVVEEFEKDGFMNMMEDINKILNL